MKSSMKLRRSIYEVSYAKKVLCTPVQMLKQSYVAKVISRFFQSLQSPIPTNVTSSHIEKVARYYLQKHGCTAALRGYHGFPSDISVNVNNVVAHGIPNETPLQNDDIVVVDIVAHRTGEQWFADASWTFCVGTPSEESQYLIRAAWNISCAGVGAVRAGARISDIAYAVEEAAYKYKMHVYTQFTGHGIGAAIHQRPQVLYDYKHAENTAIVPGMVLCIEPIVSAAAQPVKKNTDNSYVGTKGHKIAVFEHMVGVFSSHAVVMSHGCLLPQDMPMFSM